MAAVWISSMMSAVSVNPATTGKTARLILTSAASSRIPAVTEVGAGTRSTTGPVTVILAGRASDVTPTSMSAQTSPVTTEEPARTGSASTPVTVCLATMGTTASWMLTSVTGTN